MIADRCRRLDRSCQFAFEKMRDKSGNCIAQRGLARAIGADHRDKFTFIHLQIKILQNRCIGKWILVGNVLRFTIAIIEAPLL